MKNKKNRDKTPPNTFEEEIRQRRSYMEDSEESDLSDDDMSDLEGHEDYKGTNKRVSKTPSRSSTSSANSNESRESVNLGEILRRQMGGGAPVEKMRETKTPGKLPSGSGDHLKHLGKGATHKNPEKKMPGKLSASRGDSLKSLHTKKANPSHSRSTAPAVNFGTNPNGSRRNISIPGGKTIATGIGKDAFNEIRLKIEEQLRGIASSAEEAKKLAATAARQAEAGKAEQAAAAARQAEAAIAEIQRLTDQSHSLLEAARVAHTLRFEA